MHMQQPTILHLFSYIHKRIAEKHGKPIADTGCAWVAESSSNKLSMQEVIHGYRILHEAPNRRFSSLF
jgi:hypothetical protein